MPRRRRGGARTATGLRLRELVRSADVPAPEDAASRVSAYVYGNVLVMAVLISLRPEDLQGASAVLSVLGVGLSTAVAHLVGQAAGSRIRSGRSFRWTEVRRELRDTLPICTAAAVPAAILLLPRAGVADAGVALVLALVVTDLRLAVLGSAVEWFSGERSSRRLFLAGLGLALFSAAAAVLKWQLTH